MADHPVAGGAAPAETGFAHAVDKIRRDPNRLYLAWIAAMATLSFGGLLLYVLAERLADPPFVVTELRVVYPETDEGGPVALMGEPVVYRVTASLRGRCTIDAQRFLVWQSPVGPAEIPVDFVRSNPFEPGANKETRGVYIPRAIEPGVYRLGVSYRPLCDTVAVAEWEAVVAVSQPFTVVAAEEAPGS